MKKKYSFLFFCFGIMSVFAKGYSQADPFGIKMIYPTKPGGETWFMDMQNATSDPRFAPGNTIAKNADGSWKMKNIQVRMAVYTSTGYDKSKIATYNQATLASKGYMQAANDWKNVEMTSYIKVNSYTSSTNNGAAHLENYARGGKHSSSTSSCEGTSYHSNLYVTGRSKFEKELEHTAGYTSNDPQKQNATVTLKGKWIGIKSMFYNLPNGSVKIEQWVDEADNGAWKKIFEFTDDGTWGGGSPNCSGKDNTIISWGGPLVSFRWDNIDDLDFKWLSAREIDPNPTATGISYMWDKLPVIVYPNPVSNELFISFSSTVKSSDNPEIIIMDVMGKAFKKQLLDKTKSIHSVQTSELSDGIYLLQIHTGREMINTRFIVIH